MYLYLLKAKSDMIEENRGIPSFLSINILPIIQPKKRKKVELEIIVFI